MAELARGVLLKSDLDTAKRVVNLVASEAMTMMTRKNFEAAAAIVRESSADVKHVLARGYIVLFRADNPRFDAARFLNACQLQPQGEPVPLPPPT